MEDFLGIIVVVLFYLFAAASGKKRKDKKKQSRQNQPRRNDPVFEQAFGQNVQVSMEEIARKRSARNRMPAQEGMPGRDKACNERPIHLHETTQQQMQMAGEGEDPCHAGGLLNDHEETAPFFSSTAQDVVHGELAQDVLRGVIMSEILTRPCDRAALKRSRRSAV